MYGIDPDQLKIDLAAAKEKTDLIESTFDTEIKTGFEAAWKKWILAYKKALNDQGALSDLKRRAKMNQVNPAFILRNHLLETAI
jgi:uncharacterized protein YdiU (UPF0061 family)